MFKLRSKSFAHKLTAPSRLTALHAILNFCVVSPVCRLYRCKGGYSGYTVGCAVVRCIWWFTVTSFVPLFCTCFFFNAYCSPQRGTRNSGVPYIRIWNTMITATRKKLKLKAKAFALKKYYFIFACVISQCDFVLILPTC